MRCETLQGRKKEPLRRFAIGGKTTCIMENPKRHGWNDVIVRYLDHIVQIDITHDAPAEHRGRYSNLVNLLGFEETNQGMPLAKRPGYHEAIQAITEVFVVQKKQTNAVGKKDQDIMKRY